jgi:hypothetical protein
VLERLDRQRHRGSAGISTTTTVSVVEFSPLVPGASYEFWVVGRNRSAGEGPESNHVSYTAPVGP